MKKFNPNIYRVTLTEAICEVVFKCKPNSFGVGEDEIETLNKLDAYLSSNTETVHVATYWSDEKFGTLEIVGVIENIN